MSEKGVSYIVPEPERAYKVLRDLFLAGFPAMCVTRIHPEKLHKDFPNIALVWLSTSRDDPRSTRSSSIGVVGQIVDSFLREQDAPKAVLIDGLEYLVANNGFGPVIRWLFDVVDAVASTNSILLVVSSPKAFTSAEFALLKRNLRDLP